MFTPALIQDTICSNCEKCRLLCPHSRPQSHDPSDLRQGSRILAGPDFLSMCRVFVSYSQPIRFASFDGKPVNRGLPVLDKARALDPCRRSKGSWLWGRECCVLGTRFMTSAIFQCPCYVMRELAWRVARLTVSVLLTRWQQPEPHKRRLQWGVRWFCMYVVKIRTFICRFLQNDDIWPNSA